MALAAFFPKIFAFVARLPIIRLSDQFITCTHRLCTPRSEWNSCGSSSLAMRLSHLSFQIRCADSDITILNSRFSPMSGDSRLVRPEVNLLKNFDLERKVTRILVV